MPLAIVLKTISYAHAAMCRGIGVCNTHKLFLVLSKHLCESHTHEIDIVSRLKLILKVTVLFERCFRLMEHISVILCRNPINLYITEKLVKSSKTLFYFYLVISNK